MNVHLYEYSCPRWYGIVSGLRNMYTEKDMKNSEIKKNAIEEAEKISGSKSCDISLILKYQLSINSTVTYPNITKIPFNVSKNNNECYINKLEVKN